LEGRCFQSQYAPASLAGGSTGCKAKSVDGAMPVQQPACRSKLTLPSSSVPSARVAWTLHVTGSDPDTRMGMKRAPASYQPYTANLPSVYWSRVEQGGVATTEIRGEGLGGTSASTIPEDGQPLHGSSGDAHPTSTSSNARARAGQSLIEPLGSMSTQSFYTWRLFSARQSTRRSNPDHACRSPPAI
jgi:hypothetical protein